MRCPRTSSCRWIRSGPAPTARRGRCETAERHRRVGDSTPRHRSLPPISLPVPNAWQQSARQSSTLLFCAFPHQEFIHEAGGSVEEFNVIFCGRYSYFESRRTLWSASSLRIRARDCATNESMVSATDASRYSIADGSRHSLVRRGGGDLQAVQGTYHPSSQHPEKSSYP